MTWSQCILTVTLSVPVNLFAQSLTGEVKLLEARTEETGVIFHVRTGGCTKKADFGVEPIHQNPLIIRLVRIRPDVCQGLVPKGTEIRFSYAEMGAPTRLTQNEQRHIVIVNPVIVNLH